jgi:prolyl-tRNA editing enzyme YbaK/EbsC (Cys-tRNA(Pro) deacylase)
VPALDHPRVQEVARALRALGATDAADGIRVLPEAAPTAQAAADQLGCTVGAIANSLIFAAGDAPVLIMTSGSHRVDTARVADLLGIPGLDRADAEQVRAWTGQPIGGVAPLGHPAPIGTLFDVELARHPVVWAAAGHPHTVFPTTYDELLRLTDGTPAEVGP